MSIRYYDTTLRRWVEPPDMELVRGEKPWLAEVWEPLTRKVPNPCIAQPFCCYVNTVIFYLRPYIVRRWHHLYRWRDGWHAEKPGMHLEEWGRVETRLRVEDFVQVDGEDFGVGCGRVEWRGKGRGWWMRHPMRRVAPREAGAA